MIGIGRKGAQHARAYRIDPRTEIVAAADTDEENLEVFSKRFGVRGYIDYREMLRKESIDIAAPILPVGPNPTVVIGCAEAGVKGILCEKPFAPSLKEADAMVAACRANGVKIGAGDLNINLPAYQTAAQMIAEGEIGEVKSIHFYGGGGTELSGGGIQQFSLMRMFAGFAEVAWCIGWVDDDPWKDYDQGGSGYVRFVNGVEAFISREKDARGSGFQVNCTGGVFVSNADVLHMFRSPGRRAPRGRPWRRSRGCSRKPTSSGRRAATESRTAGSGRATGIWRASRCSSITWSRTSTRPEAATTAGRCSK